MFPLGKVCASWALNIESCRSPSQSWGTANDASVLCWLWPGRKEFELLGLSKGSSLSLSWSQWGRRAVQANLHESYWWSHEELLMVAMETPQFPAIVSTWRKPSCLPKRKDAPKLASFYKPVPALKIPLSTVRLTPFPCHLHYGHDPFSTILVMKWRLRFLF